MSLPAGCRDRTLPVSHPEPPQGSLKARIGNRLAQGPPCTRAQPLPEPTVVDDALVSSPRTVPSPSSTGGNGGWGAQTEPLCVQGASPVLLTLMLVSGGGVVGWDSHTRAVCTEQFHRREGRGLCVPPVRQEGCPRAQSAVPPADEA